MAAELNSTMSLTGILEKAREAESEGNLEQAASLYEKIIQERPREEFAFDRLMIIYRKLKRYKDEVKIIDAGIKAFENLYKSKHSGSRKIAEISSALLKSTGLADKKGNQLYEPEPMGKWKKRKALVEKKIK